MICPHCNKETSFKKTNLEEYKKQKRANAFATIKKRKANGSQLGRPPIYDRALIKNLKTEGLSVGQIAARLKCSIQIISKVLK